MPRKPISDAVKKKLFALSGNQCNFNECTQRIYDLDENVLLGEICHIKAVNPNGARFDPEFSEDQINNYDNLILLCPNHHAIIDKNEKDYSSEYLIRLKIEHEQKFYRNADIFDELTKKGEASVEEDLLEEVEISNQVLESKTEVIILPAKKSYDKPNDYINRGIYSLRNPLIFSIQTKSLIDIIEEESRITLLGVAGSGKSIELDNLAYQLSLPDSTYYPIKIRLNTLTNQSIEELLRIEFVEFDQIPDKNKFIILDALDEVHTDYVDVASRNIINLSRKFPDSKIVVSCRNNFYSTEVEKGDAKLEGFSTFMINSLNFFSINNYIDKKIGAEAESLIADLQRKKFYDLLYSPFYLTKIVDYFKKTKTIPDSKKTIFEFLIKERSSIDSDKYRNSGLNIDDYYIEVEHKLEELALVMVGLGKNFLDERTELLKIVSDRRLLKMIKHTYLFNKSERNELWEFEHNNFKEYLAAKSLAKLTVDKIKHLISFAPNFTKVKPTWLNTLSFLFSILEKNDPRHLELLSWLLEIEPDVLIRFEKDKIQLETRERIFTQIYRSYESKGIIIRNEKFESEDLAYFVSDSDQTLQNLINKVKNSNNDLVISEAIRLFDQFDNKIDFKSEIRGVLLSKIIDQNYSNKIKYECLSTLNELKISDKELTVAILAKNDLDSSQYIRMGFYRYIQGADHISDFLEVLLEGLQYIDRQLIRTSGNEDEEPHLLGEKYVLEGILDNIKDANSLKRILAWAVDYGKPSYHDDTFFELIGKVLEKIVPIQNSGEENYLKEVTQLLLVFAKNYYRRLSHEFKGYYSKTNNSVDSFKALFELSEQIEEDSSLDIEYAIATVCDENCIDHLIDLLREGRLSELQVMKIRNLLSWEGDKNVHDKFYSAIIEIDKEKYGYNQRNQAELKEIRKNEDLRLLFDKEAFLLEVKSVFQEEEKDKLNREDLFDYRKRKFNDEEMSNNIIVETLRSRTRDKNFVYYSEIERMVNDDLNWLWFKLHKIVWYDKNDESYEFSDREKEFINDWVKKSITEANFRTAITLQNGTHHYRYTEPYLAYFIKRLNLKFTDEKYLDFLSIDCFVLPKKQRNKDAEESELEMTDWVLSKSGVEKTKARVLLNIQSPFIIPEVRRKHYKFCAKHKIKEASEIIFSDIISTDYKEYHKREFVDYFIDTGGDLKKLEEVIQVLDTDLQDHIVRRMIGHKFWSIKPFCIEKILIESDSEVQLRYISFLIEIDNYEGFHYIKNWILSNKTYPSRWFKFESLTETDLDDLIEIYEDSIMKGYAFDKWNGGDECLLTITEIGSSSDTAYYKVKNKLEEWSLLKDETKFLFYRIQRLEQEYYSKKSQVIDFDEILDVLSINNPKIKGSFWSRNKSTLEVIGWVVGIFSLILTVLSLLI